MASFRHRRHQDLFFFFFNDTATTEIYTLSLHDALPISAPPLAAAFLARSPGRGRSSESLPGWCWNSKCFFQTMDQQLHSPGNYTLNRPCKGGSQSSRSFRAAAHAPIAMLVSTLTQKRMAVVSPGCRMYADRKLSRIQMANITMNRRDSLSPLAIKKQHPLHPKISSRPELSNSSRAAVPRC